MGDFRTLMRQTTAEVSAAHTSWENLYKLCRTQQEQHRRHVTGTLRMAGWKGEAAGAGMHALDAAEVQLGIAESQALSISTVLDTLKQRMDAARSNLRTAVKEAEADGFYKVSDDGTVTGRTLNDAERHDPDFSRQVSQIRGEHQARIDAIVDDAKRASGQAADLLRKFIPAQLDKPGGARDAAADAAAALGQNSCPALPSDDDPKKAAAWWKGLSPDERAMVLATYPEQVGKMNGLPTDVRDQANRTMLDTWIAERAGRGEDPESGKLRSLIGLRNRMDRNDGGPAGHRMYLIGLDPEDDGRAIVSVGNPDTAEHTAVFVPGTGSDLSGLSGSDSTSNNLNRTENLVKASEKYGGEGNVAGVMWLDYDAPDGLSDATRRSYAHTGGAELSDYLTGMETTHQGGERHVTAVGHSYGTTTIGGAAQHGGLVGVDDVVTAGSPGVMAPHASDLGVGANHVWAQEAYDDPVPEAGRPFLAGDKSGADVTITPDDPMFGGNRMTTDTTGHSDYWVPDSTSLDNQAKVVGGRGDLVVHEQVPMDPN
ncbi:hypothetical protein SRB5_35590 [Streptomyces sp. RB5]|uniref:DUF1023 domain-containing protein n=1 Tax=Streptomyces smaragdinus TaxID=2585196 RepID=A0A7K0CJ28_9ACTN|nr:alpha/beta hydrolase [Streptomyces smaragdinus]MQY13411.1 hypothetical protein [Streptomyces smaragdinus]